jgi:hypothetical protein
MIKTRDVLKKVTYAVAVLAMLTATFAVAQVGNQQVGTPIGGVDRSVGGVDRSVNASVGERGGGSSGARPQPRNAAAAMWAPTRNGGGISPLVPSGTGASHPGGMQEQSGSEQAGARQVGPKQGGAKKEGRAAGSGMRAGKASASSFGTSSESAKSEFGFTGKYQGSKSHKEAERKKAGELKIAKEMETKDRVTSGGRSKGKHAHVKAPGLKTTEPQETKGEENCDHASKLHLCVWL